MSDDSEWTVSAEALRKDQDPHVLMRQNVTSVPNLVRFVARAQFPQRPVADFRIEKRLPAPPGTTTRLSILGLTGDTLMHLFIDLVTAVVQGQLAFPLASLGILVGVFANTVAKLCIALVVGRGAFRRYVGFGFGAMLAANAALVVWFALKL